MPASITSNSSKISFWLGRFIGRLRRVFSWVLRFNLDSRKVITDQQVSVDSPQVLARWCRHEFIVFWKVRNLLQVLLTQSTFLDTDGKITGEHLKTLFLLAARALPVEETRIFSCGRLNPYAERSYFSERLEELELIVENFRIYLRTGNFRENAFEESVFEKAARLLRLQNDDQQSDGKGINGENAKQVRFREPAARLSFIEKRILLEYGHDWSCFQPQGQELETAQRGLRSHRTQRIQERVGDEYENVKALQSYLISERLRAVT